MFKWCQPCKKHENYVSTYLCSSDSDKGINLMANHSVHSPSITPMHTHVFSMSVLHACTWNVVISGIHTLYTFTPTQHKTEVLLRVLRPPYGGMAPFHAQVVYGRSWFHSMTRTMHTRPGGGWYVHGSVPCQVVHVCMCA